MSVPHATSLLLVGLSNNGKTHYGFQLEGRLHRGECRLKINGEVMNREPFAQAGVLIAQGKSAPHTPPGVDRESVWPVITDSGIEADLIWPDYSGETIRQIIQERRVDERWRERIRQSGGWMFLIRPQLVLERPDVWERPNPPTTKRRRSSAAARTATPVSWHEQTSLVELLQILLFVKRTSLSHPVVSPPLTVGLTCWDELDAERQRMRPRELLRKLLPLFASFVEANWDPARLAVYGISATGKKLQPKLADDDFQNLGAHTQGWVIEEDGSKTSDLTIPIAQLVELVTTD